MDIGLVGELSNKGVGEMLGYSYGYTRNTIGWLDERKDKLTEQLEWMLGNNEENFIFKGYKKDQLPKIDPYLRHQNFIGVAITNLEYLQKNDLIELLDHADQIYLEIMLPELSGRTFIGTMIHSEPTKWDRGVHYNLAKEKEYGVPAHKETA